MSSYESDPFHGSDMQSDTLIFISQLLAATMLFHGCSDASDKAVSNDEVEEIDVDADTDTDTDT
ncbi:MAG TPA: hypothetical protein DFR83_10485, partial [Deltaproteobacteria bacterium]|nr:hypothetical protein [Deltaproteobacteria bacterium]